MTDSSRTGRRLFQPLTISGEEIAWRLHCVVGIVVYLFAGVEADGLPQMIGDDIDENLRKLLEVTVPLMSASTREVMAGT